MQNQTHVSNIFQIVTPFSSRKSNNTRLTL